MHIKLYTNILINMKHKLILVLFSLFFVTCNNNKNEIHPSNQNSQENIKLINKTKINYSKNNIENITSVTI